MNDAYQYGSAQITVQNAQPGQNISIVIAPAINTSDTITWSTGNPNNPTADGITVSATGGVAVPLSSLSVNGTVIDLQTSGTSGTGVVAFSIGSGMLASGDLSIFQIKSDSDDGPILTFNFVGNKAVTLSQNFIIQEFIAN